VPLRDVMIVVLLVLDDLAALPGLPPLQQDRADVSDGIRNREQRNDQPVPTNLATIRRIFHAKIIAKNVRDFPSSIRTERASHFSRRR